MRVLNPIYDTVFKYLMEDIEIPKGLISAIIGQEIKELIPAPEEQVSDEFKIKYATLELQRLDYVGIIKTDKDNSKKDNYEKVMIEVQKSPFTPEIGRFRGYLAEKYKNISIYKNDKGEEEQAFLPIKTIYIIEETFNDKLPGILKSDRQYIDVLKKVEYKGKRDKFIDLLTHEAYFIQVYLLPYDMQNTITRLLSIFTPYYRDKDQRYLNYPEDDLEKIKHKLFRRIIQRLYLASQNSDLKRQLQSATDVENYIEKMISENKQNKQKLEQKNQQLEQNKLQIEQNSGTFKETRK
ncbi:MAG: hypothetical protein HY738_10950 [Bacteroidia bacterium]|nr:hypothetical protein [Bacteroidia bacterium]